jgi:hypothetical protein
MFVHVSSCQLLGVLKDLHIAVFYLREILLSGHSKSIVLSRVSFFRALAENCTAEYSSNRVFGCLQFPKGIIELSVFEVSPIFKITLVYNPDSVLLPFLRS